MKPTQAHIEAIAYRIIKAPCETARDDAIDEMEAALTAAAQVGEPPTYFGLHGDNTLAMDVLKAATIERCAQVAETWEQWTKGITAVQPHRQIAAAIRKLKDAP